MYLKKTNNMNKTHSLYSNRFHSANFYLYSFDVYFAAHHRWPIIYPLTRWNLSFCWNYLNLLKFCQQWGLFLIITFGRTGVKTLFLIEKLFELDSFSLKLNKVHRLEIIEDRQESRRQSHRYSHLCEKYALAYKNYITVHEHDYNKQINSID